MLKHLSIRAGIFWLLLSFGAALIGISGYAWLNAQHSEEGITELYQLSALQVNPLTDAYGTLMRSRIALAAGFVELQAGEKDKAEISAGRSEKFLTEAKAKFDSFPGRRNEWPASWIGNAATAIFCQLYQGDSRLSASTE